MKVAITGGAGFIGSVLAKRLQEDGHDLVLVVFPKDSVIADVRDPDALLDAFKGVDAIYHLAAEHRDDVSPISKYYDVNVDGGQNVIDAAKANDIQRIIFSSTVAVYGLDAGESVETDTPSPFNDYGQSKLDSEQTFKTWADEDNSRSLTIMRLVATFGTGNRGNIFTLMNQIAGGKFVMIGDGSNKKSIAYVGNVAAFLHHALSYGAGTHLYNYADKPDLNMRDFVLSVRKKLGRSGMGLQMPYALGLIGGGVFDVAAKITGKKFPVSTIRVKKFCADTVVNADKIHASDFDAPYSLHDGLEEMINAEFKRIRKDAA